MVVVGLMTGAGEGVSSFLPSRVHSSGPLYLSATASGAFGAADDYDESDDVLMSLYGSKCNY